MLNPAHFAARISRFYTGPTTGTTITLSGVMCAALLQNHRMTRKQPLHVGRCGTGGDESVPIIRTNHERDFFIASNAASSDPRLSYKARGILMYLLSKPDNWKVIIADLAKQSPDGERAVRAGMQELIDHGYTQRKAVRDSKGRFIEWEYTIFESPLCQKGNLDTSK
jgi:hypothetical protein